MDNKSNSSKHMKYTQNFQSLTSSRYVKKPTTKKLHTQEGKNNEK